tara:strand:+ start:26 stop:184 length:159 start_codon:yes stop_codon:yes gene_type:complete
MVVTRMVFTGAVVVSGVRIQSLRMGDLIDANLFVTISATAEGRNGSDGEDRE